MPKKNTIGAIDLAFHHLAASLVSHILTDMGFEVERIRTPHEKNFQRLKAGDTDMLTSGWLPSSYYGYKAELDYITCLENQPSIR